MRLYLIRHAEAASGAPDELRHLTEAGRAAARALGQRLAQESDPPQRILTSPLVRARETGDELSGSLAVPAEADERLAPGATVAGVVAAATEAGAAAVAVVAHQPDCGRIAAELGGGSEPAFPPAGVAVLQLPC